MTTTPTVHGRVRIPRLKDWRLSRGLTQVELAAKADVSRAAIVNIEHGGLAMGATVRRLAYALRTTPEELLGEPQVMRMVVKDVPSKPQFQPGPIKMVVKDA